MDQRDLIHREILGLYDRYAPGLYQYVLDATGNRETAEEAVQEIFFRYFLERIQTGRILHRRSWLFRTMRQYLETKPAEAPGRERPRDVADWRQHPESAVQQKEIDRELLRLAPRELACVRLRIEGMRYEEIASALNIRPGTVGALLARAMTKLRRAFGRPAPEGSQYPGDHT